MSSSIIRVSLIRSSYGLLQYLTQKVFSLLWRHWFSLNSVYRSNIAMTLRAIILLMSLVGVAVSDECGDICTAVPGACSHKGSYCKNGHACMDLYLSPEGVLCNSQTPGYLSSFTLLLCKQARIILSSGTPGLPTAPAPSGSSRDIHGGDTAASTTPAPRKAAASTKPPKEKPKEEERPPVPSPNIKGIKNLGATCYLGSFLQVVLHSRTIRDIVMAENPQVSAQFPVFREFANLVREMNYNDESSELLDVHELLKALRTFNENRGFKYNEADDAYLSGAVLMNALAQASPALARATSTIVSLRTICGSCGDDQAIERKADTTQLVRIINPDTPTSLVELLTAHFSPASVQDVRCSACRQKPESIRIPTVQQTPDLFVVGIFRYAPDVEKLMTSVELPFELDMDLITGGAVRKRYRLMGIVRHKKDHYVSDYFNSEAATWVHTDDKRVHAIRGLPGNAGHEPTVAIYEAI